jgi:hypothetical protein
MHQSFGLQDLALEPVAAGQVALFDFGLTDAAGYK